jgi:hypothetical protein
MQAAKAARVRDALRVALNGCLVVMMIPLLCAAAGRAALFDFQ